MRGSASSREARATSRATCFPRPLYVLVFSAPVGAGHDAAAAGLAVELRAAGATVDVVDGLALLGIERLVVSAYRFQILHAAWSWRLLYRLTRSRALIRMAGTLLARLASRRLIAQLAELQPDVVVSAYPIVSTALAGLRRRARLPQPCATLVTDFDPHPGWIHPDLDANLVVGPAGRTTQPISPPIPPITMIDGTRERVRAELGIDTDQRVVLIVGGAWGVGNLEGAARAVAAAPDVHAIVVTGRNERLYRALRRDRSLGGATILGFTHRMPELMAASDLLIQNAGGLTCLEAFAAGLPVVMFDPVPGHGEDGSRLLTRAGLVATAADAPTLRMLVASESFWRTCTPDLVARARQLFERQSAGSAVRRLGARPVAEPGRVRRLTPAIAVSIALGAWFIAENPPRGYDFTAPRQPAHDAGEPANALPLATPTGLARPTAAAR